MLPGLERGFKFFFFFYQGGGALRPFLGAKGKTEGNEGKGKVGKMGKGAVVFWPGGHEDEDCDSDSDDDDDEDGDDDDGNEGGDIDNNEGDEDGDDDGSDLSSLESEDEGFEDKDGDGCFSAEDVGDDDDDERTEPESIYALPTAALHAHPMRAYGYTSNPLYWIFLPNGRRLDQLHLRDDTIISPAPDQIMSFRTAYGYSDTNSSYRIDLPDGRSLDEWRCAASANVF